MGISGSDVLFAAKTAFFNLPQEFPTNCWMACGRDIYKIATNADTIGIEIMDNSVEMQIPLDTRVTSRLYSIQSMDTFPAIGQPERIVEISKSMRFLIKNLRTRKVITGRPSTQKSYRSRRISWRDSR